MNKDSFLHAIAIIAAVACFFSSCSRQGNISVPASDPNILYMGRIHWSDTLTADFNYPGVTAMLNFNGTGLSMAAKPGSGQFMVEVDNDDAFKINAADTAPASPMPSRDTRNSHRYTASRSSDPMPNFFRLLNVRRSR